MPKKNRIAESKLIKALAELEGVAKGDPLEEADPEGGLSTEGEPLSDAAPSGRGEKTKKSRAAASSPFGGASSSTGSSSSEDDDDDGVSDAMSPPPKKTKGKDKKKVSKARSASSSAASSDDDDGSDDDSDAEKSFREQAEGDETLRKGMIVNDFLEHMVDQLSLALLSSQKSIAKAFEGLEARLSARIDARVEKSSTAQQGFNARLAKAVHAIGNIVQDDLLGMADTIKSLADQPAGSPRGKAVLSKGEVNQPPWGGPSVVGADQRLASGSDDYTEQLRELPASVVADQLFKMAANDRLDQNVILAFEADRYDVGALPAAVRKALANELIK